MPPLLEKGRSVSRRVPSAAARVTEHSSRPAQTTKAGDALMVLPRKPERNARTVPIPRINAAACKRGRHQAELIVRRTTRPKREVDELGVHVRHVHLVSPETGSMIEVRGGGLSGIDRNQRPEPQK
jgi:hypothetical protein